MHKNPTIAKFLLLLTTCAALTNGLEPFRGECKKEAMFRKGKNQSGKALTGHVIASHDVTSRLACADKCLGNTGCRSYNYQEIGTPLHTCELSSHTKTSMPAAFVSKAGYSYYDADKFVLPVCASFPCQNGGTCSEECRGFHVCECKPEFAGENCEEWFGFNGSSPFFSGKSCFNIKLTNQDTGDGEYWIDPTHSGQPITVLCDMTTDKGGWTVVKNLTLTTASPSNVYSIKHDYRKIENLDPHGVLSSTVLQALKRDMGFTQIRYYCHKASVGRVFHIMTANNASGFNVVRYFTEAGSPFAAACESFIRLPDDTSILSRNCSQWGFSNQTANVNQWGHSSYTGQLGLYMGAVVWYEKHRVRFLRNYECDDKDSLTTIGDTWIIAVR